MEMERINENTIRVLIENDDLTDRGITFLDLLGNHKQIESFFYSILEEVDVEEQFQETDAITFQVLPNRDGLELFISKNANLADDEGDFTELADSLDQEGFSNFLKKQMGDKNLVEDNGEESTVEVVTEELVSDRKEVVVSLSSFENMIQLSKELYLSNGTTNLYEMNHQYFLEITFYTEELTDAQIDMEVSRILEYSNYTPITPEVLAEYGKLVMERSALELTRYYFK